MGTYVRSQRRREQGQKEKVEKGIRKVMGRETKEKIQTGLLRKYWE